MDETRIDNLESHSSEVRKVLHAVEERLCKIEARLEQTVTKTDLSELRVEMYKAIAETKTWMLASMVTIIGVVLAALFGLQHWGLMDASDRNRWGPRFRRR
jgi:hypothetical protein